jgi:RNA polymerase sigma factor (sigma-70 family)
MGVRTGASLIAATDAELLTRVRRGDEEAYGELFERHAGAARRLARSLVGGEHDAEDVISEVFAAILVTLRRGNGPTDSFGPYLFTSIRHECARMSRRRGFDRPLPLDGTVTPDDQPLRELVDPYDSLVEGDAVTAAFAALPRRYQTVLWESEVCGRSHMEIAKAHGTNAACVATLALRARRALSTAYLERHLGPTRDLPKPCRDVRNHLAAYVRGDACARWVRRIDDHNALCGSCALVLAELAHLNQSLAAGRLGRTLSGRVVPPPALLGMLGRLQAWLAGMSMPAATAATLVVAVAAGPMLPPVAPAEAVDRPPASSPVDPVGPVPVARVELLPVPIAVDQPPALVTPDPAPLPPDVARVQPRPEPAQAEPSARRRPATRRRRATERAAARDTPPSVAPATPATDAPEPPSDKAPDVPRPVEEVTRPIADRTDPVVDEVEETVEPVVEEVTDVVAPVVEPVVEDVVAPVVEDVVTDVVAPVVKPVVDDVVAPVVDDVIPVDDAVDGLLPGG